MLWRCRRTALGDFRDDLARAFSSDPAYLILNIPPRPGGWPGSIFSSDMRFAIVRGNPYDPALARAEFNFGNSIELDLSTSAGAKVANFVSLSADAGRLTKAPLNVLRGRTYELTLGQVKAKLAKLGPDERKPAGPVAVYRAVEGIFELKLTRKTTASAEAWGKLRTSLINGAGGRARVRQTRSR